MATATVAGSPYAIIASGAVGFGLGNYTISYLDGALTVNPAPLTITADSMTKIYGQAVTFAGTAFTTCGLFNSDSVAGVSLSSTGAAATATVAGSPYAIIVSGAVGSGLGNYTISYVNGALTVSAAPLDHYGRQYDQDLRADGDLPGTEFTTRGLVNSDSVASVEHEQHRRGGNSPPWPARPTPSPRRAPSAPDWGITRSATSMVP